MLDDDAYLSRLQATIASLRYWKPAISDAARIEESEADGVWRLAVAPRAAGACPFTISLARTGHYALTIAGEAYPERLVDSLDIFVPLTEAIVEGRVLQRHWSSPLTGIATHLATLVMHADGSLLWSDIKARAGAGLAADVTDGIRQDRYFLPYRRR